MSDDLEPVAWRWRIAGCDWIVSDTPKIALVSDTLEVRSLIDGPEAASRIAELEAARDRHIAFVSEVREACGIGFKPALSEVPDAIWARMEELSLRCLNAEADLATAVGALEYAGPLLEVLHSIVSAPDTRKTTWKAIRTNRQALASIKGGRDVGKL